MADEVRNLFPVVDLGEFEEAEDAHTADYKPSLMWDCKIGDFVRDTSNKVLVSDGIEAFRVWCSKAVATERFHCLAYDDDMGTEMEDAMKEENDEAVELAIERTITEALMANPRTGSVEDFTFEWEPDAVHVFFYVVCAEGWESFPVETRITR